MHSSSSPSPRQTTIKPNEMVMEEGKGLEGDGLEARREEAADASLAFNHTFPSPKRAEKYRSNGKGATSRHTSNSRSRGSSSSSSRVPSKGSYSVSSQHPKRRTEPSMARISNAVSETVMEVWNGVPTPEMVQQASLYPLYSQRTLCSVPGVSIPSPPHTLQWEAAGKRATQSAPPMLSSLEPTSTEAMKRNSTGESGDVPPVPPRPEKTEIKDDVKTGWMPSTSLRTTNAPPSPPFFHALPLSPPMASSPPSTVLFPSLGEPNPTLVGTSSCSFSLVVPFDPAGEEEKTMDTPETIVSVVPSVEREEDPWLPSGSPPCLAASPSLSPSLPVAVESIACVAHGEAADVTITTSVHGGSLRERKSGTPEDAPEATPPRWDAAPREASTSLPPSSDGSVFTTSSPCTPYAMYSATSSFSSSSSSAISSFSSSLLSTRSLSHVILSSLHVGWDDRVPATTSCPTPDTSPSPPPPPVPLAGVPSALPFTTTLVSPPLPLPLPPSDPDEPFFPFPHCATPTEALYLLWGSVMVLQAAMTLLQAAAVASSTVTPVAPMTQSSLTRTIRGQHSRATPTPSPFSSLAASHRARWAEAIPHLNVGGSEEARPTVSGGGEGARQEASVPLGNGAAPLLPSPPSPPPLPCSMAEKGNPSGSGILTPARLFRYPQAGKPHTLSRPYGHPTPKGKQESRSPPSYRNAMGLPSLSPSASSSAASSVAVSSSSSGVTPYHPPQEIKDHDDTERRKRNGPAGKGITPLAAIRTITTPTTPHHHHPIPAPVKKEEEEGGLCMPSTDLFRSLFVPSESLYKRETATVEDDESGLEEGELLITTVRPQASMEASPLDYSPFRTRTKANTTISTSSLSHTSTNDVKRLQTTSFSVSVIAPNGGSEAGKEESNADGDVFFMRPWNGCTTGKCVVEEFPVLEVEEEDGITHPIPLTTSKVLVEVSSTHGIARRQPMEGKKKPTPAEEKEEEQERNRIMERNHTFPGVSFPLRLDPPDSPPHHLKEQRNTVGGIPSPYAPSLPPHRPPPSAESHMLLSLPSSASSCGSGTPTSHLTPNPHHPPPPSPIRYTERGSHSVPYLLSPSFSVSSSSCSSHPHPAPSSSPEERRGPSVGGVGDVLLPKEVSFHPICPQHALGAGGKSGGGVGGEGHRLGSVGTGHYSLGPAFSLDTSPLLSMAVLTSFLPAHRESLGVTPMSPLMNLPTTPNSPLPFARGDSPIFLRACEAAEERRREEKRKEEDEERTKRGGGEAGKPLAGMDVSTKLSPVTSFSASSTMLQAKMAALATTITTPTSPASPQRSQQRLSDASDSAGRFSMLPEDRRILTSISGLFRTTSSAGEVELEEEEPGIKKEGEEEEHEKRVLYPVGTRSSWEKVPSPHMPSVHPSPSLRMTRPQTSGSNPLTPPPLPHSNLYTLSTALRPSTSTSSDRRLRKPSARSSSLTPCPAARRLSSRSSMGDVSAIPHPSTRSPPVLPPSSLRRTTDLIPSSTSPSPPSYILPHADAPTETLVRQPSGRKLLHREDGPSALHSTTNLVPSVVQFLALYYLAQVIPTLSISLHVLRRSMCRGSRVMRGRSIVGTTSTSSMTCSTAASSFSSPSSSSARMEKVGPVEWPGRLSQDLFPSQQKHQQTPPRHVEQAGAKDGVPPTGVKVSHRHARNKKNPPQRPSAVISLSTLKQLSTPNTTTTPGAPPPGNSSMSDKKPTAIKMRRRNAARQKRHQRILKAMLLLKHMIQTWKALGQHLPSLPLSHYFEGSVPEAFSASTSSAPSATSPSAFSSSAFASSLTPAVSLSIRLRRLVESFYIHSAASRFFSSPHRPSDVKSGKARKEGRKTGQKVTNEEREEQQRMDLQEDGKEEREEHEVSSPISCTSPGPAGRLPSPLPPTTTTTTGRHRISSLSPPLVPPLPQDTTTATATQEAPKTSPVLPTTTKDSMAVGSGGGPLSMPASLLFTSSPSTSACKRAAAAGSPGLPERSNIAPTTPKRTARAAAAEARLCRLSDCFGMPAEHVRRTFRFLYFCRSGEVLGWLSSTGSSVSSVYPTLRSRSFPSRPMTSKLGWPPSTTAMSTSRPSSHVVGGGETSSVASSLSSSSSEVIPHSLCSTPLQPPFEFVRYLEEWLRVLLRTYPHPLPTPPPTASTSSPDVSFPKDGWVPSASCSTATTTPITTATPTTSTTDATSLCTPPTTPAPTSAAMPPTTVRPDRRDTSCPWSEIQELQVHTARTNSPPLSHQTKKNENTAIEHNTATTRKKKKQPRKKREAHHNLVFDSHLLQALFISPSTSRVTRERRSHARGKAIYTDTTKSFPRLPGPSPQHLWEATPEKEASGGGWEGKAAHNSSRTREVAMRHTKRKDRRPSMKSKKISTTPRHSPSAVDPRGSQQGELHPGVETPSRVSSSLQTSETEEVTSAAKSPPPLHQRCRTMARIPTIVDTVVDEEHPVPAAAPAAAPGTSSTPSPTFLASTAASGVVGSTGTSTTICSPLVPPLFPQVPPSNRSTTHDPHDGSTKSLTEYTPSTEPIRFLNLQDHPHSNSASMLDGNANTRSSLHPPPPQMSNCSACGSSCTGTLAATTDDTSLQGLSSTTYNTLNNTTGLSNPLLWASVMNNMNSVHVRPLFLLPSSSSSSFIPSTPPVLEVPWGSLPGNVAKEMGLPHHLAMKDGGVAVEAMAAKAPHEMERREYQRDRVPVARGQVGSPAVGSPLPFCMMQDGRENPAGEDPFLMLTVPILQLRECDETSWLPPPVGVVTPSAPLALENSPTTARRVLLVERANCLASWFLGVEVGAALSYSPRFQFFVPRHVETHGLPEAVSPSAKDSTGAKGAVPPSSSSSLDTVGSAGWYHWLRQTIASVLPAALSFPLGKESPALPFVATTKEAGSEGRDTKREVGGRPTSFSSSPVPATTSLASGWQELIRFLQEEAGLVEVFPVLTGSAPPLPFQQEPYATDLISWIHHEAMPPGQTRGTPTTKGTPWCTPSSSPVKMVDSTTPPATPHAGAGARTLSSMRMEGVPLVMLDAGRLAVYGVEGWKVPMEEGPCGNGVEGSIQEGSPAAALTSSHGALQKPLQEDPPDTDARIPPDGSHTPDRRVALVFHYVVRAPSKISSSVTTASIRKPLSPAITILPPSASVWSGDAAEGALLTTTHTPPNTTHPTTTLVSPMMTAEGPSPSLLPSSVPKDLSLAARTGSSAGEAGGLLAPSPLPISCLSSNLSLSSPSSQTFYGGSQTDTVPHVPSFAHDPGSEGGSTLHPPAFITSSSGGTFSSGTEDDTDSADEGKRKKPHPLSFPLAMPVSVPSSTTLDKTASHSNMRKKDTTGIAEKKGGKGAAGARPPSTLTPRSTHSPGPPTTTSSTSTAAISSPSSGMLRSLFISLTSSSMGSSPSPSAPPPLPATTTTTTAPPSPRAVSANVPAPLRLPLAQSPTEELQQGDLGLRPSSTSPLLAPPFSLSSPPVALRLAKQESDAAVLLREALPRTAVSRSSAFTLSTAPSGGEEGDERNGQKKGMLRGSSLSRQFRESLSHYLSSTPRLSPPPLSEGGGRTTMVNSFHIFPVVDGPLDFLEMTEEDEEEQEEERQKGSLPLHRIWKVKEGPSCSPSASSVLPQEGLATSLPTEESVRAVLGDVPKQEPHNQDGDEKEEETKKDEEEQHTTKVGPDVKLNAPESEEAPGLHWREVRPPHLEKEEETEEIVEDAVEGDNGEEDEEQSQYDVKGIIKVDSNSREENDTTDGDGDASEVDGIMFVDLKYRRELKRLKEAKVKVGAGAANRRIATNSHMVPPRVGMTSPSAGPSSTTSLPFPTPGGRSQSEETSESPLPMQGISQKFPPATSTSCSSVAHTSSKSYFSSSQMFRLPERFSAVYNSNSETLPGVCLLPENEAREQTGGEGGSTGGGGSEQETDGGRLPVLHVAERMDVRTSIASTEGGSAPPSSVSVNAILHGKREKEDMTNTKEHAMSPTMMMAGVPPEISLSSGSISASPAGGNRDGALALGSPQPPILLHTITTDGLPTDEAATITPTAEEAAMANDAATFISPVNDDGSFSSISCSLLPRRMSLPQFLRMARREGQERLSHPSGSGDPKDKYPDTTMKRKSGGEDGLPASLAPGSTISLADPPTIDSTSGNTVPPLSSVIPAMGQKEADPSPATENTNETTASHQHATATVKTHKKNNYKNTYYYYYFKEMTSPSQLMVLQQRAMEISRVKFTTFLKWIERHALFSGLFTYREIPKEIYWRNSLLKLLLLQLVQLEEKRRDRSVTTEHASFNGLSNNGAGSGSSETAGTPVNQALGKSNSYSNLNNGGGEGSGVFVDSWTGPSLTMFFHSCEMHMVVDIIPDEKVPATIAGRKAFIKRMRDFYLAREMEYQPLFSSEGGKMASLIRGKRLHPWSLDPLLVASMVKDIVQQQKNGAAPTWVDTVISRSLLHSTRNSFLCPQHSTTAGDPDGLRMSVSSARLHPPHHARYGSEGMGAGGGGGVVPIHPTSSVSHGPTAAKQQRNKTSPHLLMRCNSASVEGEGLQNVLSSLVEEMDFWGPNNNSPNTSPLLSLLPSAPTGTPVLPTSSSQPGGVGPTGGNTMRVPTPDSMAFTPLPEVFSVEIGETALEKALVHPIWYLNAEVRAILEKVHGTVVATGSGAATIILPYTTEERLSALKDYHVVPHPVTAMSELGIVVLNKLADEALAMKRVEEEEKQRQREQVEIVSMSLGMLVKDQLEKDHSPVELGSGAGTNTTGTLSVGSPMSVGSPVESNEPHQEWGSGAGGASEEVLERLRALLAKPIVVPSMEEVYEQHKAHQNDPGEEEVHTPRKDAKAPRDVQVGLLAEPGLPFSPSLTTTGTASSSGCSSLSVPPFGNARRSAPMTQTRAGSRGSSSRRSSEAPPPSSTLTGIGVGDEGRPSRRSETLWHRRDSKETNPRHPNSVGIPSVGTSTISPRLPPLLSTPAQPSSSRSPSPPTPSSPRALPTVLFLPSPVLPGAAKRFPTTSPFNSDLKASPAQNVPPASAILTDTTTTTRDALSLLSSTKGKGMLPSSSEPIQESGEEPITRRGSPPPPPSQDGSLRKAQGGTWWDAEKSTPTTEWKVLQTRIVLPTTPDTPPLAMEPCGGEGQGGAPHWRDRERPTEESSQSSDEEDYDTEEEEEVPNTKDDGEGGDVRRWVMDMERCHQRHEEEDKWGFSPLSDRVTTTLNPAGRRISKLRSDNNVSVIDFRALPKHRSGVETMSVSSNWSATSSAENSCMDPDLIDFPYFRILLLLSHSCSQTMEWLIHLGHGVCVSENPTHVTSLLRCGLEAYDVVVVEWTNSVVTPINLRLLERSRAKHTHVPIFAVVLGEEFRGQQKRKGGPGSPRQRKRGSFGDDWNEKQSNLSHSGNGDSVSMLYIPPPHPSRPAFPDFIKPQNIICGTSMFRALLHRRPLLRAEIRLGRLMKQLAGDHSIVYQVTGRIGSGGFGDVYEVSLHASKGRLAMKRIPVGTITLERMDMLFKEVAILRELDHRNIVQLSHITCDNKYLSLFMELCEYSLDTLLQSGMAVEQLLEGYVLPSSGSGSVLSPLPDGGDQGGAVVQPTALNPPRHTPAAAATGGGHLPLADGNISPTNEGMVGQSSNSFSVHNSTPVGTGNHTSPTPSNTNVAGNNSNRPNRATESSSMSPSSAGGGTPGLRSSVSPFRPIFPTRTTTTSVPRAPMVGSLFLPTPRHTPAAGNNLGNHYENNNSHSVKGHSHSIVSYPTSPFSPNVVPLSQPIHSLNPSQGPSKDRIDMLLILRDVISAVKYLHDFDIVHRDIKPQNILLLNGVAKLADFGSATTVTKRQKGLHTMKGTLPYMAPEVFLSEPYSKECDIWSLGVLFAELFGLRLAHSSLLHFPALQEFYKSLGMDESMPVVATNYAEGSIKKLFPDHVVQSVKEALKQALLTAREEQRMWKDTLSLTLSSSKSMSTTHGGMSAFTADGSSSSAAGFFHSFYPMMGHVTGPSTGGVSPISGVAGGAAGASFPSMDYFSSARTRTLYVVEVDITRLTCTTTRHALPASLIELLESCFWRSTARRVPAEVLLEHPITSDREWLQRMFAEVRQLNIRIGAFKPGSKDGVLGNGGQAQPDGGGVLPHQAFQHNVDLSFSGSSLGSNSGDDEW